MKRSTQLLFKAMCCLSLLIISAPAEAQVLKSFGGSESDTGFALDVDFQGFRYIGGTFEETVEFETGLPVTASAGADLYIAKYSDQESLSWVIALGNGEFGHNLRSLEVAQSGEVYVSGNFRGTLDFEPNAVLTGDTKTTDGSLDAFIAKYTSSGSLVWVKTFGAEFFDTAADISLDESTASLYVTGRVGGTVDFDSDQEITDDIQTAGSADVFTAKYDLSGQLQWVRIDIGGGQDSGSAIDADSKGNIYVGGFSNGISFPPMPNGGNPLQGGSRIFLVKFNPQGEVIWAKSEMGGNPSAVFGLTLSQDDHVFLTGHTSSGGDFDPDNPGGTISSNGGRDAFLAKYDEAGMFQWVKGIGGTTNDEGSEVDIDADGYSYLTGNFSGTGVDFDRDNVVPGDTRDSAFSSSAYLAKYDPNGMLTWVKSFGGSGSDEGLAVALGPEGAFVSGTFENTVDFEPDVTIQNSTRVSNGQTDVFYASYNSAGFLSTDLVVNSSDDVEDGFCNDTHCSLREAITAANAIPGHQYITFDIDNGNAPVTIQPLTQLPAITETATIDGGTQSCSGGLCIELDGSQGTASDGLQLTGSDIRIRVMVINRFADDGIEIFGSGALRNTIDFVWVGVSNTGTASFGPAPAYVASERKVDPEKGGTKGDDRLAGSLGNGFGIYVDGGASETLVTNCITSGNQNFGIGFNSGANTAEMTKVGTGVTGTEIIPNGGTGIQLASSGNLLGRVGQANFGNVIAHNTLDGVVVANGQINNILSANKIFANGEQGIDLGLNGTTANDAGDADTGANNLQNFPSITDLALTDGVSSSMGVTYLVDSAPANSAYPLTVEFFRSVTIGNDAVEYLGADIYTEAEAQTAKTVTLSTAFISPNQRVVATATDANGNTSEISAGFLVAPELVVNSNNDVDDGTCDGTHCSLREAINAANTAAGPDKIVFSIAPLFSTATISPSTQLPTITDAVIIDGFTQFPCGSNARCIELDGSNLTGFEDGLVISGNNSLIRGLVINRFPDDGIQLNGGATGNTIESNLIGTDATGEASLSDAPSGLSGQRNIDPEKGGKEGDDRLLGGLGNGFGIYIVAGGGGNTIKKNTISGNQNQGILLASTGSGGNIISENRIGMGTSSDADLGNGSHGVDTFIGQNIFEGNRIAYNSANGIRISNGLENEIRGNSIFENNVLGIDIGAAGPTPNDLDDADIGANNLQNFPVISTLDFDGSSEVSGFVEVLSTVANSAYPLSIDFYIADADGEEGKDHIGTVSYTAPQAGLSAPFEFTASTTVTFGSQILATATDANGNTSEFSAPVSTAGELGLYWTDQSQDRVYSGDRDGLGVSSLLFDNGDSVVDPQGIAIDPFAEKAYWGQIDNKIFRANLDGSGTPELLFDASDGIGAPENIVLDIPRGVMYWTDSANANDSINSGAMDGSGSVTTLVNLPTDTIPVGLAIDFASGKMFWSEYTTKAIKRANLNGNGIDILYDETDGLSNPTGLDLDVANGHIYWGEVETGLVRRADLDGRSGSIVTLYDAAGSGLGRVETVIVEPVSQKIYISQGDGKIFKGNTSGSGGLQLLYQTANVQGLALGFKRPDLTVHFKRLAGWGIPGAHYYATIPNLGSPPDWPSEPMVAEGCGWYSYTIRGAHTASLVFNGGIHAPALQTVDINDIDKESWYVPTAGPSPVGGTLLDTPPADYTNCNENIFINGKVFLSGAYDDTIDRMSLDLNGADLLPVFQPFADPLFNDALIEYNGHESDLQITADGIIAATDWVLLELRTDPNDPLTTVAQAASWVDALGNFSAEMAAPSTDYYLVVRHRNSLPIMTATASAALNGQAGSSVDFTTAQTQAWGTNPMIQVDTSPVAFAMRGADGDLTSDVTSFDFVNIWLPQNGGPVGYDQGDFNLDGSVTAFDFLNVWLPNNGQSSQIPE